VGRPTRALASARVGRPTPRDASRCVAWRGARPPDPNRPEDTVTTDPTVTKPVTKPGQPEPRLMLTVEQAAERLAIGRTTMFALIKSGEIETVRIGRLRRVPADAITAYTARKLAD
jgi:excisionase family DNA binding protein